ncbi:MAG: CRISPR-associated endonuclease Cas6 [Candidatus Neomarinimicrobiota bacterium]
METSIKSVVLKLNTDKPVRKTPYQVKGVFIRHFKNELIVPMLNGSNRHKFLYPRVQVKILNEQIYIIGLKEGLIPVISIAEKVKKLDFGNITFDVESFELLESKNDFISSKQVITYSFLTPWIALNHMNQGTYKKSNGIEQRLFLNKLIGQNIVFLANELNLSLEKNIYTKLEISELSPRKVDEKNWGSFEGGFKTNCILPNYIGLGNGITRGFGSIYFDPNHILSNLKEEETCQLEDSNSFKSEKDLKLVIISDVPKPRRRKNTSNKSKFSKKNKAKFIKNVNSKKKPKKYSKNPNSLNKKTNRYIDSKNFNDNPIHDFNTIEEVKDKEEKNFNTEEHHKRQHKF